MAVTLEQRLMKIEQEIKSLKAIYSVYGGLMKTYFTEKTIDVTNGSYNLKVKFTPSFSTNKKTIISSVFYKVTVNGNEFVLDNNYISVQDGSGEVIFNFGPALPGTSLFIQIASMVPGTFTRIA